LVDVRAIVFDLDDTLYPYRQFVSSGFRAVAQSLEDRHGVPAALALRTLRRASTGRDRGRELQRLCETFALESSLVPSLVALMHAHMPTLQLPTRAARVLRTLRPGWRLGVLTNGSPSIQARKVDALNLTPLVDAVVFAAACGSGEGKPSPDAFAAVLARLGASPEQAVFVGNDPVTDMAGAARAGMKTIYVSRSRDVGAMVCDAVATSLREVPALARRLVRSGGTHVH
jgi:putative hydrolase of the HAD superfamily